MRYPEADQYKADLEALKALQADVSKLEQVERLLDRYNVFEAIGFVGQEVMHSRFLAFLLDPQRNHGLGTSFLEGFLRMVSKSAEGASLPSFDITDSWNLDSTRVRTEVYTGDGRIDILLVNEAGKWVMIIENKVWTTEHHDQLDRYYRFVKKNHPGWRVQGLYLTPSGSAPSHRMYVPFSYRAVCEMMDGVLEDRGPSFSPDVRMSIRHYVQMLRRNIVGDPEIARLCQQIYQKHKRAFDLIIEHRPDPRVDIQNLLTRLINDTDGLVHKGQAGKRYVAFRPSEWETPAALNAGEDKLGFIRFLFVSDPDSLTLYLQVTPGDEEVRRRLYEMGHKDESLFNDLVDPETNNYPNLYHRTFLGPEFYEEASDSEREQEIRKQWSEFIENDLPRMQAIMKQETWIREPVEEDDPT